jgi:hypothetical protein
LLIFTFSRGWAKIAYHTRVNRVGINAARAAELLEVTIEDVKRFDIDGNKIAERYLLLWDKKHLNTEGWQGWLFSRGTLRFKGMQWRPENLIHDRQFRESLEMDAAVLLRKFSTR